MEGRRLIIRNLAFSETWEGVKSVFSEYGAIDERTSKLLKGFAFITFKKKEDAARALAAVNGSTIHERVVAVDYSLPKDKYVEKRKKRKKQQEEEEEEEEEEDEEDEEEDDEEEDDDDDDEEEQSDDRSEAASFDVSALRAQEADRKLFVRNVPFDAEPEDLAPLFSSFGEVAQVLITRDRHTGISKGTCFVIFKEAAASDACLQSGENLYCQGRRLIVDRCLAPPALEQRLQEQQQPHAKDPRNLHLAQVGHLDQQSPQWSKLTPEEQEKRARSNAEKKAKLKNPNYHVSRTRLSIRNLHPEVDEKQLRRLFKGKLKQVKVVRDAQGKSRGFAFVEYLEHEPALQAVHQHNNSTHFPKKKRPIVEFALDDQRKLQKQKARNEAALKKLRMTPAEREAAANKKRKKKQNKKSAPTLEDQWQEQKRGKVAEEPEKTKRWYE